MKTRHLDKSLFSREGKQLIRQLPTHNRFQPQTPQLTTHNSQPGTHNLVDNDGLSGDNVQQEIQVSRNKKRSFWNYVWSAVRKGIMEALKQL